MGIFAAIGAGLAKVFAGGVVKTAVAGADIVERWVPSAEGKHEMALEIDKAIQNSVAGAREHDSTIGNVPGVFNAIVNSINRLIRPGVTIGLIGGVVGVWPLPATGTIDPVILGWTEMVLIFWFGGRALFKDLPSLIKYVQTIRK